MLSIDAWLDEKPYKEIYDGVVHEKVSPQRTHAILSGEIYRLLRERTRGLGDVGVEWRVYLTEGTTLVPDVAFVSRERLAALSPQAREKPPFSPDIVVEVRSPEDREANIRRKTDLYLEHGAGIVLNVYPDDRTVRVNDRNGERVLQVGDAIEHPSIPGFHIPVDDIFTLLDRD